MLNRIDESILHNFRPKRSKIYFEVPHTDFCWSLCRFILCNSVWFRLSRFETTKMTKRGQMSTNLSPLTSQSHKIRRLFVQSDEYLDFTFPIYKRHNSHRSNRLIPKYFGLYNSWKSHLIDLKLSQIKSSKTVMLVILMLVPLW